MIAYLLVAASLGLSAAAASDLPQAPPTELVLAISASPILPGGKDLSYARASDPTSFTEYLFSMDNSPCSVGGSVRDLASPPTYGWRVSGRVLQRLDENLLVQIEWQRLWEQSQRLNNGLKGSMQVSLHVGDRLPLDEIYVPAVPGCDALGTRLEATVFERVVSPPRAKMRGTGAMVGVGAGRGSGSGMGSGQGQGETALAGFGPGISSLAAPVAVELWLVHTLPDGGEKVQRMTVPASPSSRFRFPAIKIATAEGDATVEISGGVAAVVDVSGEKQLRMLIQRRVSDNPLVIGGGTSISAYQMPKPGDVYSFETPALRVKGVEVKSDRVSLRLRLAERRDGWQ